jgi:hypothetical protein
VRFTLTRVCLQCLQAEDEEDEEGGTLTLGLDMEERWSPAPIYIGEKDGDGWDGTVGDGDDGSGVTELNFGVVGVGEAREVRPVTCLIPQHPHV